MKITTVLEIRWGVIKVIALDDSIKAGATIETVETWTGKWTGIEVQYRAQVRKYDPKAGLLHLEYKRRLQPNPGFFEPPNDVRWGTWKLSWDVAKKRDRQSGKTTTQPTNPIFVH